MPRLRFSLRDYGLCMATLLVFCLGSLFYQLGGGPPRFLIDLRRFLGKEARWALRLVVPAWRGPGDGGWVGAHAGDFDSPRWDMPERVRGTQV